MHATPLAHDAAPHRVHLHRPASAPAYVPTAVLREARADANDDARFVDLLNAYRCSGGLARAAEASRMVALAHGANGVPQPLCVGRRKWIAFEWQAQTWLPCFQLLPAGPLPAPAIAAVLNEIHPIFDEWEIAQWFVRRNASLNGRTPVEALGEDPRAVLHAARCDRYIARA